MDLTGFWSGSYWYYEHGQPVVPFLANLDENGGHLSGTISEPDSHFGTNVRIEAFVIGRREAMRVTFAKTYDGAGPMAHRVDYTGTLSDDAKTIRGSWYFAGLWGAFSMTRELLEAEEETEHRADTKILLEADLK